MNKLVDNGKQYEIICKGNYGYDRSLTKGKTYITLEGVEAGLFEGSPYVSFVGDDGKKHQAHASRFEIVKEVHNETINT